MWIVWTGGNDRFWDGMTASTFGAFDLLKIVAYDPSEDDRPRQALDLARADQRTVLRRADRARPRRGSACCSIRAGPIARPTRSPTRPNIPASRSARAATTVPVGSYYGDPTGIVGLRLFPNPDFDEAAAKRWDAGRYFTDPSYYNDKNLVRPYRVGMSCGFCHVGPSPINPPANPAHPEWANLSSTVGAQYMWVDRLFIYSASARQFHVPAGPHLPAGQRWTPRWCRPTTSTTRAR